MSVRTDQEHCNVKAKLFYNNQFLVEPQQRIHQIESIQTYVDQQARFNRGSI